MLAGARSLCGPHMPPPKPPGRYTTAAHFMPLMKPLVTTAPVPWLQAYRETGGHLREARSSRSGTGHAASSTKCRKTRCGTWGLWHLVPAWEMCRKMGCGTWAFVLPALAEAHMSSLKQRSLGRWRRRISKARSVSKSSNCEGVRQARRHAFHQAASSQRAAPARQVECGQRAARQVAVH